jgi:hypothetical protein
MQQWNIVYASGLRASCGTMCSDPETWFVIFLSLTLLTWLIVVLRYFPLVAQLSIDKSFKSFLCKREGNFVYRITVLWQHCHFVCTLNYATSSARLLSLLDTELVMLECGKETDTVEVFGTLWSGRRQPQVDISGHTTCHLRAYIHVCKYACIFKYSLMSQYNKTLVHIVRLAGYSEFRVLRMVIISSGIYSGVVC